MQLYLWINIIWLLLSIAFSFIKKIAFYKDFFYVLPAIIIPAFLFITIDYFFCVWGIWGFNKQDIAGVIWFGLPMEKVLFYFIASYSSLLLYAATKAMIRNDILRLYHQSISVILVLLLTVFFFAFRQKLFTSVTALLCLVTLTYRMWIASPKSLSRFYLAYLIGFIPVVFYYSLLTSRGILWHDPKQIIGIQMGVIPVEHSLYFLALFLMNVGIYDYFKVRKEAKRVDDDQKTEVPLG